jgi:hypothetical protein
MYAVNDVDIDIYQNKEPYKIRRDSDGKSHFYSKDEFEFLFPKDYVPVITDKIEDFNILYKHYKDTSYYSLKHKKIIHQNYDSIKKNVDILVALKDNITLYDLMKNTLVLLRLNFLIAPPLIIKM